MRHVDTGKHLTSFASNVLVRCVACNRPGTVKAVGKGYSWDAEFNCVHCHLKLRSTLDHWVGPVQIYGRRPCGYCGFKWLKPNIHLEKMPLSHPSVINFRCPECGNETEVNLASRRVIPGDSCIDPHFGLPLILATSTRRGTVWAYNLEHLKELVEYISAKLRTRQNSGNRSMFSRLPKWMKLAKHRDDVLKALAKLQFIVLSGFSLPAKNA